MKTLGRVEPQMLIQAVLSRHTEAHAWGVEQMQAAFGPILHIGPEVPFDHSRYYNKTMGEGLLKRFYAFERLVEPETLADVKRQSIELEQRLIQAQTYGEARPINIDPGFLGLGKFILATTKDQAHRIYLRDGIFAEVTLRYHEGEFEPRPWTYTDWQHPEVLRFLKEARKLYAGRKVGCDRSGNDNRK